MRPIKNILFSHLLLFIAASTMVVGFTLLSAVLLSVTLFQPFIAAFFAVLFFGPLLVVLILALLFLNCFLTAFILRKLLQTDSVFPFVYSIIGFTLLFITEMKNSYDLTEYFSSILVAVMVIGVGILVGFILKKLQYKNLVSKFN